MKPEMTPELARQSWARIWMSMNPIPTVVQPPLHPYEIRVFISIGGTARFQDAYGLEMAEMADDYVQAMMTGKAPEAPANKTICSGKPGDLLRLAYAEKVTPMTDDDLWMWDAMGDAYFGS